MADNLITTPGGIGSEAVSDGGNVPAPGNDANQIQGWAQKYLGRNFSDADIQALAGQPLDLVMHNIANSDEASKYAASQQAQTSTPATTTSSAFTDALSQLNTNPLLQPWTVPFNAQPFQSTATYTPSTLADLYADPGYEARLEAGRQTMEKSAAAKGNLLTGGTLKDEDQAAQDYASNEFQNVSNRNLTNFGTAYNRDLTDWTTNYNASLQQYQQAYNIFANNQNNASNKLNAWAGLGQTTAGQLGSAGLGYANLFGNTQQQGAGTIGDLYTQAGNANAAGQVGSANAWGSTLGNTANNLSSLYASSYGK